MELVSQRGIQRERAVRDLLLKSDWLAFRAPASLGVAVECKSTARGPYHGFGPADRRDLSFAARLAGADAYLAWWPPRGQLRWIAESEWPCHRIGAAA